MKSPRSAGLIEPLCVPRTAAYRAAHPSSTVGSAGYDQGFNAGVMLYNLTRSVFRGCYGSMVSRLRDSPTFAKSLWRESMVELSER